MDAWCAQTQQRQSPQPAEQQAIEAASDPEARGAAAVVHGAGGLGGLAGLVSRRAAEVGSEALAGTGGAKAPAEGKVSATIQRALRDQRHQRLHKGGAGGPGDDELFLQLAFDPGSVRGGSAGAEGDAAEQRQQLRLRLASPLRHALRSAGHGRQDDVSASGAGDAPQERQELLVHALQGLVCDGIRSAAPLLSLPAGGAGSGPAGQEAATARACGVSGRERGSSIVVVPPPLRLFALQRVNTG